MDCICVNVCNLIQGETRQLHMRREDQKEKLKRKKKAHEQNRQYVRSTARRKTDEERKEKERCTVAY